MKLIVMGAEGPMGKALLCSILEKYGFINLPVRKRGLNSYVIGERKIKDLYFKKRTLIVANDLAISDLGGGISVIERNKNPKIKKINLKKINKNLKIFYKKKFTKVDQMYFQSMLILNNGIIYKKKIFNPKGCIENSKDISNFDYKELINGYKNNFNKPYFIFLNRNFSSWLNSLASQIMVKNYKNVFQYRIRLSGQIKRYKNWQKYLTNNKKNGINLDFNDFFNKYRLKKMIKKISFYLNEKDPKINWPKEKFDCFGYIYDYKKAFKKIDDKNLYLSKISIKVAKHAYSTNVFYLKLLYDFIFQILFLLDLIKFKNNKKYK